MEYVIGILLLLTFVLLVVYSIRGGNLMMGFLIMGVLWTALPLIGNKLVTNPAFIAANQDIINTGFIDAVTSVFQGGPEGWGSVLVNVIFGAWFGRVLLETGIAATIIRKTVELGGDKPVVVCILLSIVETMIFATLIGDGAVIAIGVIVLPIMLGIGVPKLLALGSYMASIGAGMYLNPTLTAQFFGFFLDSSGQPIFTYTQTDRLTWSFIGVGVQLGIVILMIIVLLKKDKVSHAWAAAVGQTEQNKNVPVYAMITPLIPVVLLVFFNVPIILGFIIGSFYAMGTCGCLKSFKETCQNLNRDFFNGVVDTAPMDGFLLMLPIYNKASELCVPYFSAVLGSFFPKSTLVICIIFAVLAPLGLFRGPFTLFGCGAAILGMLKALGFDPLFLYALMVIPAITMNVSVCMTQSWIAWGLNYTKTAPGEHLKANLPACWLICIIMTGVTYFMFG